ncbi:hypothetical protein O0I10_007890 [Lichtheimia ornata]|uniref:Phosphatidate cytidylyltransferase n=1 Tax=Lichtheimia ornata TaxID=688661 RepID=A0AAD7V0L1_9FUNG|nr:uncharacterized protein O0I10_007890 [Lichtheimia ornata]KAJ8656326.1 hypothetical protein O0I10_007890 [Lichtheimia ornata]
MTAQVQAKKKRLSIKKIDRRFAHIQPEGSWEIPRKAFHYSIGFLVVYLYMQGVEAKSIYPPLIAFLSVVLTTEVMRFSSDSFNVLYCKVCGPLMRQSEVKSRINGVAYYLAGCIFATYFFPTEIASMSIIYLSWADPTASICGRLWGRYTPRFGKKSLAGTSGAIIIGALVTFGFLIQHESLSRALAYSVYGGLVAGFSEALGDSAGLDDNLVIPVVSSIMLWIPLVGLDSMYSSSVINA